MGCFGTNGPLVLVLNIRGVPLLSQTKPRINRVWFYQILLWTDRAVHLDLRLTRKQMVRSDPVVLNYSPF